MDELVPDRRLSWEDVWPQERARILRRREAHGLSAEVASPSDVVCLSLSGGGIRSATFALGFMRALAKARMLECVDYLSTVSGGGYAGSFFASLFQRRPAGASSGAGISITAGGLPLDPPQATAYDFMRGPVCRPDASSVGIAPLGWPYWWLRNSGRYLAPTGAGDYVYAAALGVRNVIAIHYVIGLAVLMAACVALMVDGLVRQLPGLPGVERVLVHPGGGWVLLAAALTLTMVMPLGLAYFLTEMPNRIARGDKPWWHTTTWRRVNIATLAAFVLTLLATPGLTRQLLQWLPAMQGAAQWLGSIFDGSIKVAAISGLFGGIVWVSLKMLDSAASHVDKGLHLPQAQRAGVEAAAPQGKMLATRVELTKRLASALKWTLAMLGIAALLVAASKAQSLSAKELSAGGLSAAGLVAAVRKVAPWLARRLSEGSAAKLPLEPLMLMAGFALASIVAVAWFAFARWLVGAEAGSGLATDHGAVVAAASALLGALVPLAWLSGKSFQFINLSSIQNLYSSRLVRAYLGASNPARAEDKGSRWIRISDTHPDDNLTVEAYYDVRKDQMPAPLHLINVTVNETVSPSDPLVQRDRQGRPMALSPDHLNVDGVWYPLSALKPPAETGSLMGSMRDGLLRAWRRLTGRQSPAVEGCGPPAQRVTPSNAPEAMSIGSWIGISGAAFSTGLGRGTSIGKSLLLGLANVRLGHWWFAGVLAQSDEQRGLLAVLMRWLARQFQTQAYLLAELLGRFSGRYAPYWYLSDGGHHENTAVYEALRRRVGIVICTDCGADPQYAWQDLANLIRLARIELGCEFKELLTPSLLAKSLPGKDGPVSWQQLSHLLVQPNKTRSMASTITMPLPPEARSSRSRAPTARGCSRTTARRSRSGSATTRPPSRRSPRRRSTCRSSCPSTRTGTTCPPRSSRTSSSRRTCARRARST